MSCTTTSDGLIQNVENMKLDASPAEFSELCNEISKRLKSYVGTGKSKNEEMEYLSKAVKILPQVYKNNLKNASKKKKSNGTSTTASGVDKANRNVNKPIAVDDVIVEFAKTGNFKNLNAMKDLPLIVKNGAATSSTLTRLFILYVKSNNLQDPKNGQRIMTDSLLKRLFGQDLQEIQEARTKDGKSKEGATICPDYFYYWTIQNIICRHKKSVSLEDISKKIGKSEEEVLKELETQSDKIAHAKKLLEPNSNQEPPHEDQPPVKKQNTKKSK